MKALKWLIVLLILGAIGAGAYWLIAGKSKTPQGASLLPADTFLFLQTPDLTKAKAGFKTTGLYQIWTEPEVKQFFRKPVEAARQQIREKAGKNPALNLVRRAFGLPRGEVFIAVTEMGDLQRHTPPLIVGIDVREKRAEADRWIADWKAEVKRTVSEFKEEGAKYKDVSYRRWTTSKVTSCFAYLGSLLVVTSNEDTLRGAIDRYKDSKLPSLASDERFQNAIRKMPSSYSALAYCNPKPLVGLLKGFAMFMPQLQSTMRDLDVMRAVSYSTTFTNGSFEDVIFVDAPVDKRGDLGSESVPTERKTLALTSEKTLFYSVQSTTLSKVWDKVYQQLQQSPVPKVQETMSALDQFNRQHGCNMPKDLLDAVGPECGFALELNDSSPVPGLVLAIEVADKARAAAATAKLWQFAQSSAGEVSNLFTDAQADGQTIHSIQIPKLPLSPSYTVSDRFVLLTLQADTAKQALARMKNSGGNATLAKNALYQETMKALPSGGTSYAYLDTKALFERVSALAAPWVKQVVSYAPSLGEHLDLDHLPKAETISRHLHPSAAVSLVDKDGLTTIMISPCGLPLVTAGAMAGVAVAIAQHYPDFSMN